MDLQFVDHHDQCLVLKNIRPLKMVNTFQYGCINELTSTVFAWKNVVRVLLKLGVPASSGALCIGNAADVL